MDHGLRKICTKRRQPSFGQTRCPAGLQMLILMSAQSTGAAITERATTLQRSMILFRMEHPSDALKTTA